MNDSLPSIIHAIEKIMRHEGLHEERIRSLEQSRHESRAASKEPQSMFTKEASSTHQELALKGTGKG